MYLLYKLYYKTSQNKLKNDIPSVELYEIFLYNYGNLAKHPTNTIQSPANLLKVYIKKYFQKLKIFITKIMQGI